VKLPGLNLDPAELNPVRCAVCAHVDEAGKTEVVVRGAGVCVAHALLIDRFEGSLSAAVDEVLKQRRVRSAG
jgi:hypothetical protein